MNKKILVTVVAAALLLCVAVGGTIAYLTAQSDTVTNTFSTSNIQVKLTETGATKATEDATVLTNASFKVIPGASATKDPKAWVVKDSEPAWLFVKITETGNIAVAAAEGAAAVRYVGYTINTSWETLYENVGGETVIYRAVKSAGEEEPTEGNIFVDNKINYYKDITSATMNTAAAAKIQFDAYAVQYYASNTKTDGDAAGTPMDVHAAWKLIDSKYEIPTT